MISILGFEGDEKTQYLGAKSEQERDKWIGALHIASYECMKMQLESLREQIRDRTGKDPIDNPEPSTLPDSEGMFVFINPFSEVSNVTLGCLLSGLELKHTNQTKYVVQ